MGLPRTSPSHSLLKPSIPFIIESQLCLLEVVPFFHAQADPTVSREHLSLPLSHCALLCANTQALKVHNVNPCLPQFLQCHFGQNRAHHLAPHTTLPTFLTTHFFVQRQGISHASGLIPPWFPGLVTIALQRTALHKTMSWRNTCQSLKP